MKTQLIGGLVVSVVVSISQVARAQAGDDGKDLRDLKAAVQSMRVEQQERIDTLISVLRELRSAMDPSKQKSGAEGVSPARVNEEAEQLLTDLRDEMRHFNKLLSDFLQTASATGAAKPSRRQDIERAYPPDAVGELVVHNETSGSQILLVNDQRYTIPPSSDTTIPGLPLGSVTYRLENETPKIKEITADKPRTSIRIVMSTPAPAPRWYQTWDPTYGWVWVQR